MKKKYLYNGVSLVFLVFVICFPLFGAIHKDMPDTTLISNNKTLATSGQIAFNYTNEASVTYQIDINLTVSDTAGGGGQDYYYKIPRLNNLTPYQDVELLYNNIDNYDEIDLGNTDQYNNTYDSFNVTLSDGLGSESFKFSQQYNVKLNRISYPSISESQVGAYNYSDEIFDLYCNDSVQYLNTSDPDLISLSNNITTGITNPVEKASKIITWISNNIEYNGSMPSQEKGASWAYDKLEGDCSEYSDLMITLLRIQQIPARKVTGFVASNRIPFFPSVGDELSFTFSRTEATILAHAWIEYYIPNYGWIECDPTWHSPPYSSYFNTIDYLRFRFNVGEWFEDAEGDNVSEYPNPPSIYIYTDSYEYEFKATIVATDYSDYYLRTLILQYPTLFMDTSEPQGMDLSPYLYIGIGSVLAIGLLSVVVAAVLRRRREVSF